MDPGRAGKSTCGRHLVIVAMFAAAEISRHDDDGFAMFHRLEDRAHSRMTDVETGFGLKRLECVGSKKGEGL